MTLFEKLKNNGIADDWDVLARGSFIISAKEATKSALKSVLLLIFTLGMLYSIPQGKPYVMAIGEKRLNLVVDGKVITITYDQVKNIEITKEGKRYFKLRINMQNGQVINLFVNPADKKTTSLEQVKEAILKFKASCPN